MIKVTSKKTKTGATLSIRATTKASRIALAKFVLGGHLGRALKGKTREAPAK